MDSGTTIMGVVIALICALPVFLFYYNNYKKKRKKLSVLKRIEAINDCKIKHFDYSDTFLIGIESNNHLLFYVQWVGDNENIQKIDLQEVNDCLLINSTKSVGSKNNSYTIVEKVELAFKFIDKRNKDVLIELFKKQSGTTLSDELKIAEKWSKIVKNKIELQTKN